jgi:hypothetical protein
LATSSDAKQKIGNAIGAVVERLSNRRDACDRWVETNDRSRRKLSTATVDDLFARWPSSISHDGVDIEEKRVVRRGRGGFRCHGRTLKGGELLPRGTWEAKLIEQRGPNVSFSLKKRIKTRLNVLTFFFFSICFLEIVWRMEVGWTKGAPGGVAEVPRQTGTKKNSSGVVGKRGSVEFGGRVLRCGNKKKKGAELTSKPG